MTNQLKMTGERVLEDDYKNTPTSFFIYLMHLAGYNFAEQFCKGKRVLDFGCGSGYGADRIAKAATSVNAVDISQEAIDFAKDRYKAENLIFSTLKDNTPLPFENESFDVVLSSQVIEHVHKDVDYLSEASRVLRQNGVIIIITPDRSGRLLPFQKPWNRWHVREYSLQGLQNLVEQYFHIENAYKMGATWDTAKIEYQRYQKLKWLTLPFTLPFIPEKLRISGLNLLHALNDNTGKASASKNLISNDTGLSEDIFQIGSTVENPLNILIVGRK